MNPPCRILKPALFLIGWWGCREGGGVYLACGALGLCTVIGLDGELQFLVNMGEIDDIGNEVDCVQREKGEKDGGRRGEVVVAHV